LKAKHAKFKIKSCFEIKYEINTDLSSARVHRFKSVEQDFSIKFSFNLHHVILEMDKDDYTSCFRDAMVIFVWFWLDRRDSFFSFDQGFIQSSPNEFGFTSVMNSFQRLILMDLRISCRVSRHTTKVYTSSFGSKIKLDSMSNLI
jgi:hypothetical protein